ncbi:MAG: response regulator [Methanobacteriota archaeon]
MTGSDYPVSKFRERESPHIRVLYVDDDQDFLEIVKVILENKEDISVDITASGYAALELLKTGGYDIILSDYRMFRMDGMEFLKQARELDSQIPFILFSGIMQDEVIHDAIGRGITSYILKEGDPAVLFDELEKKIRAAVRHRRDDVYVSQ